jgi:hypothetical protein
MSRFADSFGTESSTVHAGSNGSACPPAFSSFETSWCSGTLTNGPAFTVIVTLSGTFAPESCSALSKSLAFVTAHEPRWSPCDHERRGRAAGSAGSFRYVCECNVR